MIKSDTYFSNNLKMTASLGGGFSYSDRPLIKEMTLQDVKVQNVQLSVNLIKDEDALSHNNSLLSASFNLEKVISSYVDKAIDDPEPDLINVLYTRQSLIKLKTHITKQLAKLEAYEDALRATL